MLQQRSESVHIEDLLLNLKNTADRVTAVLDAADHLLSVRAEHFDADAKSDTFHLVSLAQEEAGKLRTALAAAMAQASADAAPIPYRPTDEECRRITRENTSKKKTSAARRVFRSKKGEAR